MKTKDLVTWGLIIAALYYGYKAANDCGCGTGAGARTGVGGVDLTGTCDPASFLVTNKTSSRWIRELGAVRALGDS